MILLNLSLNKFGRELIDWLNPNDYVLGFIKLLPFQMLR